MKNKTIFFKKWLSTECLDGLKIIHSYTHDYSTIRKQEFPRVSSHGLKWDNKSPKLKRSSILCTLTLTVHVHVSCSLYLQPVFLCTLHCAALLVSQSTHPSKDLLCRGKINSNHTSLLSGILVSNYGCSPCLNYMEILQGCFLSEPTFFTFLM